MIKISQLVAALAICIFVANKSQAQSIYEPYSFTTLAGLALDSGTNDGTGNLARFNQPWGVAVDDADNVYVADTLNQTIRKITPGGIVTTLAGVAGSAGFNDGDANTALFSRPTGVAVNSTGTIIYVADYNNQIIRQISGGVVSTLAGSVGVVGTNDAMGTLAQFHNPFGIALNISGTILYVTDQNNQTVRKIVISSGAVTTLAGSPGLGGSADDPVNNLNARFNTPKGIAVDSSGNVYVADTGNLTVRKIAVGGGVSTIAGSVFTSGFTDGPGSSALFSFLSGASPFGGPCGMAVDNNGNVYVTDQGNHTIRKITSTGNVTTLAGLAQTSGSDDGSGDAAQFNFPAGVAVDGSGNLFVADTANHTIRFGVNTTNDTCPNLVVNGSFETTSPVVPPNSANNGLNPTTGVPGWTTASTNFLEVWGNNVGFPASDGVNQLEINAQNADETVSQEITGLSTNCPATFSFDYTGSFGVVDGTPNNDFTVTISSGGVVFSVSLDPANYTNGGWVSFYTNFIPTTSTVTIAFRGQPHFSDGKPATQGGAHIDNVSLYQCCDTSTSACPEEAPLDTNGNLIVPDGMDTNLITYVEVNHLLGTVEELNPGFDTSVDLWYTNLTCQQSIGGIVPTNASNPDFTNMLAGIGITNVSPEEIVLTYSNWNVQIASQAVSETLSFPTAGPVGPPYYPPAKPHCPDPTKKYAFGGRDIIFVHGLQLSHIFQKIQGNPHASQNWVTPTQFPGSIDNPEFYDGGYFKTEADLVWAAHIEKFLTDNGYQNRYLIVDYPCTERIEIGVQAVLTQISDAMHFGIGVKSLDPTDTDTSNFGTPSFVVVSHSTGTLLTDIAMTAASQYPNLNASYIPKMCKAHVAMDGVFSGSEEATAAVAISGFASTAVIPAGCLLADTTLALLDPSQPELDCNFAHVFASSVLVDLVPLVAQYKWGSFVDQMPVRTLTLVGGHPSYLAPLKDLIMPGFDDGVTTINSQVGNPNSRLLWPSGFRPSGLFPEAEAFDMGLAGTGNGQQSGLMSPLRAVGYYIDQIGEPLRLEPTSLLIAGGATPYLSPSGMRQNVADAYDNTHFSTLNRYHNHFSFIQSASDHLVGYTHPDVIAANHDYRDTFGELNQEESRVITDPAVYDPYSMLYPGDDAPLLDRSCVPKVETWERGRKIPAVHFHLFGHNYTWGPWWIWRRVYDLLEGWQTKMGCDYMYESVLHCPPLQSCSTCLAPPSGLALWLPFDEADGSTAYNFSSGGTNGLLYDGSQVATSNGPVHVAADPTHTTPIDSFNGGSLYFDGVDDNVAVPSYNGINFGTGNFTIAAWVKRDPNSGASSTRVIVDKRDPANDIGYSFAVTSGLLLFQMTSTAFTPVNFLDSSTVPTDNLWHFVAVTVSRGPTNSVCQFYLDGAPTATVSQTTPLGSLDNTTPLRVGSSPVAGNNPWMGGIDEVVAFTRALTVLEIQGIFNAGSSGLCKTSCMTPLVVNCPTNKTVDCGKLWNFDPPTVTGINVTITSSGFVTNGVCPKSITQNWFITDACGNSNTCSQTVTLVDTPPPVIDCPTNTIFVPLDSKCQLEIPAVQPKASDNCTPANQLIYLQDPAAGTIASNLCEEVTVVVQDLCGNDTKCQIQICGVDKTPPTLTYPKTVAATNCIVPDVLPLVSASDPCTPTNKLVFAQSPPAGTSIAAGGNVVTVTVTDPNGNTSTGFISLSSGNSPQSFLNVLFNTGVDGSKNVLPYNYPTGSVDPHYTLGPVPPGTPTGSGFYHAPDAVAFPQVLGLPPFTASTWIVPGAEWSFVIYPPGLYTFTNQFVLPPGMDPLTASISGRWAADDGATMYLNGLASINQVASMPPIGYNHWTYFTVNSGFLAFPATNKLYFVVTNAPLVPPDNTALVGLRVEFTDATINCSTCTPPAIIYSSPNQSLPVNGTAVFTANVWGTPPLNIQWYHNGQPLTNGGHFSGANTPTLTITPLSYSDAGIYNVVISNPCGDTASASRKLTITRNPVFPWGYWNFSQIAKPLAATFGPDLVFTGTNLPTISAGSIFDFGLPSIGEKNVNVLYVPPLPRGSYIQLPVDQLLNDDVASNYTVFLDFFAPSNSSVRSTLLTIFDRWGNLLVTATPLGELNVSGMLGDTSIDLDSSMPLQLNDWNRMALVMDHPPVSVMNDQLGSLMLYINGKLAVMSSITITISVDNASSDITVFSSPDGTTTESYASGIAFFGDALTPEMIASMGSPDNGPLSLNTMTSASPVLSVTTSNGMINLSWSDSAYSLQETSDISKGQWQDSMMPFEETANAGGKITTTARINPMSNAVRFYRLKLTP